MENHVAGTHELQQHLAVQDGVNGDKHALSQLWILLKGADIFQRTRGQIVDDVCFITFFKVGFGQVGSDKTGSSAPPKEGPALKEPWSH